MHNPRCVLTGHVPVWGGGVCIRLLLQGRAPCYMTAMLEDSLMRGPIIASCGSEHVVMAPSREGGPRPRIMHRSGVRRVSASATLCKAPRRGRQRDGRRICGSLPWSPAIGGWSAPAAS